MNQKRIFVRNLFLFFISITIFSCQKEEVYTIENKESRKLNIWHYPVNTVFESSRILQNKVSALKSKNREARLTSSMYNFSINENDVQVIYETNYTQYTFVINRDNSISNVLENYVCRIHTDGFIEQFLVSYPYTQNQNGIVYDSRNATMQVIQDEAILINAASRIPAGCVPEFVDTAWTYECVNVACSGPGSGSHTEPSDCLCGTLGHDCTPPHTECDWTSVNIWSYSCPNNGGDSNITGDDGLVQGGNTGNGTLPEEEIVTVPFLIKSKNPCEQLKDNLLPDKENLKQIIDSLKTFLNLPDERSVSFKKYFVPEAPDDYVPFWEQTGSLLSSPITFGTLWYGSIHTHPEGSYAMFSWQDIRNTLRLYENASTDRQPLVFNTIVCSNNEVYSLKIDNYFELALQVYTEWNSSRYNGLNEKAKMLAIDEMMQKLYFNNSNLERAFLKRFGGYGISLYKANSTLTGWSKLTLNNTDPTNVIVVATPCN